MMKRPVLQFIAIAPVFVPSLALASTTTDLISQLAGLFYIIVGLALVMSFLLMGIGLVMWAVRLGTDNNYRDNAIHVMEWGVATLFTLIIVLGIVEFVQTHTSTMLYILSIAIILLFAWFIVTSGLLTGGEKEEEEDK